MARSNSPSRQFEPVGDLRGRSVDELLDELLHAARDTASFAELLGNRSTRVRAVSIRKLAATVAAVDLARSSKTA